MSIYSSNDSIPKISHMAAWHPNNEQNYLHNLHFLRNEVGLKVTKTRRWRWCVVNNYHFSNAVKVYFFDYMSNVQLLILVKFSFPYGGAWKIWTIKAVNSSNLKNIKNIHTVWRWTLVYFVISCVEWLKCLHGINMKLTSHLTFGKLTFEPKIGKNNNNNNLITFET